MRVTQANNVGLVELQDSANMLSPHHSRANYPVARFFPTGTHR